MVLDFISMRTLRQLPHLPPHQLTQLDTWLAEDLRDYLAAAAAAGGGAAAAAAVGCSAAGMMGHAPKSPLAGSSSSSVAMHLDFNDTRSAPRPGSGSNAGSSGSNASSSGSSDAAATVTSWAHACGCWQVPDPSQWRVPPSRELQDLMREGRLMWVPAGTSITAAAGGGGGGGGSTAGTSGETAAGGGGGSPGQGSAGSYRWLQGPVDAWLSTDKATKQERAETLQQRMHPRNQGKLLLNLDAYLTTSSSSNGVHPALQQQQGLFAGEASCIELKYQDLSHKASCQLQRHPVLAAHDRLIRVTVNRDSALSSSNSSSSGVRVGRAQRQAALDRALQDVLTNGVMLAGRRYSRWVWNMECGVHMPPPSVHACLPCSGLCLPGLPLATGLSCPPARPCNSRDHRRSVSQDSLQRDPEGPSQPYASPGTQSMSRPCNSRRHQPSGSLQAHSACHSAS